MKQPTKTSFLLLAVLVFTAFSTSCKKDEDKASEEGVLRFRGFTNKDIIFYVGGEPADPSQLNMSKLLDFPEESWISADRYLGDYYRFVGDSVDIFHSHGPSIARYGYYFENDSMYLSYFDSWLQQELSFYDGIGSQARLERKHCLIYTRKMRENGTFQSGSGFNVNGYHYIEDLSQGLTHFDDLSDMGPNDTLIFFNQSQLFE